MDLTLADMNSLGLNIDIANELNSIENGQTIAIESISAYIEKLRHDDGRKIRSERRSMMVKVYTILLNYLNINEKSILFGQCCPSMATMAKKLFPEIIGMRPGKGRENYIFKSMMKVQRAIKALASFGLIKIHKYRAGSNRNDDPANPNANLENFYYEILPVSFFSPFFKGLLIVPKIIIRKAKQIVIYVANTGLPNKQYKKSIGANLIDKMTKIFRRLSPF